MMKIKRLRLESESVWKFDLNVGGFTIKNCRWRLAGRQILFPVRYDHYHRRHRVVRASGMLVQRLRDLMESGNSETPRDRTAIKFNPRFLGRTSHERLEWIIFNFTVRGFRILGCRWQPESRSIQLPVTFFFSEVRLGLVKKPVVCAYGAHIVRLQKALEAKAQQLGIQSLEPLEANA
jgi:hypothetical protein